MNQENKQAAKVALVTGGARRIGAAIVKALHAAGFKVVIHCHNSLSDAHALAVDLNKIRIDSALVLQRDLARPGMADDLLQWVKDWAGRLDVLVNNASVFKRTDCRADWDNLFEINVQAPFLLSLAARSALAEQQGAIINITDIHAEKPLKGYAIYCQTKAALEMQTKALAKEFAPDIRVNAVAPGPTVWPEKENELSDAAKKEVIEKTLLRRMGAPEYVAQAVLALIENHYITGQTLKVDGGRSV